MAKILIINPSTEGFGRHSIPITLISALLKKNNHEVKLFDTTFMDVGDFFGGKTAIIDQVEQLNFFKKLKDKSTKLKKTKVDVVFELQKQVDEFKPQSIWFSFWGSQRHAAGEFQAYSKGLRLISKIKTHGIPVVVGGLIPTWDTNNVISHPLISAVVLGEAELTYLDIANALDTKKSLGEIPNVWFKNSNGSITQNSKRSLNYNIDDLPHADFDLYDDRIFYRPYNGKLYRVADHELSRGCPNSCSFCLAPFQKSVYGNPSNYRREKSIDKILSEASYLKGRYKLDMFRYNDESFLEMDEEKLKQLAPLYREKVGIPFIIEATVKSLSKMKIEYLAQMGCASVSVGIESGSPFIREKIYQKPYFSNEEAVKKIKWVMDAGIQVTLFNIIGAPKETKEMIIETLKLNNQIRPTYTVASIYQPWEGTKLRDFVVNSEMMELKESDITTTNQDFNSIKREGVTDNEIRHYHRYFVFYVYFPRMLWPLIDLLNYKNIFSKMLEVVFKKIMIFRLKLI